VPPAITPVRFVPRPTLVKGVSEDQAVPSQQPDSDLERLQALVPKDVTARKRVLASLLRALNSDNGRV
jgi:hypothetical protein